VAIHVVLVHPEIHWNTGNAGRTCLAVGATLHLIRPLGFRLDDREALLAEAVAFHGHLCPGQVLGVLTRSDLLDYLAHRRQAQR